MAPSTCACAAIELRDEPSSVRAGVKWRRVGCAMQSRRERRGKRTHTRVVTGCVLSGMIQHLDVSIEVQP